ncbi:MAG: hypothetical protein HY664_05700 [Chloroflexi bacterium]|nr:hypothetical protein [Chloroflexota bacterium]
MWTEMVKAPNLMVAELWKELFEGEQIPARIMVDPNKLTGGETEPRIVYVPRRKKHVAEEVLRKI